jgi:hypothetical protein
MVFPLWPSPHLFLGLREISFCDELHVRFVEIQRAMHPVASARGLFLSKRLWNTTARPVVSYEGIQLSQESLNVEASKKSKPIQAQ